MYAMTSGRGLAMTGGGWPGDDEVGWALRESITFIVFRYLCARVL